VGDASLRRRPRRRVARPLAARGARVDLAPAGTLPMTIEGGDLVGVEWATEAASAQVKSAILLAGLVAGVEVTVREPVRSRDHTERMLAARGAEVRATDGVVTLRPRGPLPAGDVAVPADPSSAAFLAAFAALADAGEVELQDVCLNPTRTGFLRALARMGARVTVSDERDAAGEAVGTVSVAPAGLRAIAVDADDVPSLIDELPLLACVAARAEGETVIGGAAELRVKESDRIAAVVSNLRAIGATAEELPDGFRVGGSAGPLRGDVRTFGDHRIAMAFGVLGALPGNDIRVDDRACVGVSYPSFWRDLTRLARG
jgi:3-phosphoshikimate 1-carboxyvinyltransferase